jgi:hypothetical protein
MDSPKTYIAVEPTSAPMLNKETPILINLEVLSLGVTALAAFCVWYVGTFYVSKDRYKTETSAIQTNIDAQLRLDREKQDLRCDTLDNRVTYMEGKFEVLLLKVESSLISIAHTQEYLIERSNLSRTEMVRFIQDVNESLKKFDGDFIEVKGGLTSMHRRLDRKENAVISLTNRVSDVDGKT